MSSLSDMVSAAIAGLLSAALVHFGATDSNDKTHKQPTPAHAGADKSDATTSSAPLPADDDRFAPANPNAAPKTRAATVHRNLPGHSS